MEQKIELRFRSLPEYSSDVVYFMESGFDKAVNDAIVGHFDEIRKLFAGSGKRFVYFPLLIEDYYGALEYNFPSMDVAEMNVKAQSDIILTLLADDQKGMEVPPCIGRYSYSDDDDVPFMDAYPLAMHDGDDIMSLLGNVLDLMDEEDAECDDGIRYSQFEDFDERALLHGGIRHSLRDRIRELEADDTFDEDVKRQMKEVYDKVAELRLQGVSEWVLKNYLFPQKELSRMVITQKYDVVLPDYKDMVIKMQPIVKAIYILFLRHKEGIVFKHLPDYRDELYDIYMDIWSKQDKPWPLSKAKVQQSIENVTNPLSNSINEKCARVRAAFVSQFEESIAAQYYIDGKRGEAKRIALDRSMVEWW